MRTARIWSGLFLLAFVTSHLINLSFGLISISAMDAARPYVTEVWTGPIVGNLLIIALATHFFLGLWALYIRPTLRTNMHDIVQLLTGLLVVPLLATHAIGISMAADAGLEFGYSDAVRLFWLQVPTLGLLQVVMLSVVWVHGCAGLFTWLRAKQGAKGLLHWLYLMAVLIPVLALLGYAGAGREMLMAQLTGGVMAHNPPRPSDLNVPFTLIKQITNGVIYGSIVLTLLTLAARFVRIWVKKIHTVVLVRNGGAELISTSALSISDGFQINDQGHANLCAGRGRCGTCAVRILKSDFPLPSPSALELRTLYSAGAPEGARLACQLKPSGGRVEVQAVYPADYTYEDARPSGATPMPKASA